MRAWSAMLICGVLHAGAIGLTSGAAVAQEREIKDCPECPTMVVVSPGRMVRGLKFQDTEFPVEFRRPFAIGKYEVTWVEYDAFARSAGRIKNGCTWFSLAGNRPDPARDYNTAFDPDIHIQADDEPVLCVSHEDAQAYVAWLREKTGAPYRLPTEAEWEYAARAGSPNDAAWWTTANTPRFEMANCADCPGIDTMGREDWLFTFPVGTYQPNAWGLYDIPGNAAEWVEDCFNPTFVNAPKDGTAWLDGNCNRRIVRSGSWHHERAFLAGFRQPTPANTRINDIGFRVALSLPE